MIFFSKEIKFFKSAIVVLGDQKKKKKKKHREKIVWKETYNSYVGNICILMLTNDRNENVGRCLLCICY